MAISKDTGRQWPLVARVSFAGGTDVDAVGTYEAIDLPAGAQVTGGNLEVTTGFSGTGTIAVQIGSEVLIAASTQGSAAVVDFSGAGSAVAAGDTVDIVTAVAALTDGAATLTVEYVIDGRANEVQP